MLKDILLKRHKDDVWIGQKEIERGSVMSIRLVDANELISAVYYYEHEKGELTAFDVHDIINKAPTIAHVDGIAVQSYKESETDCQWK